MEQARLLDLELIRQLKYRYMRGVDTHDVDLIRSCFAENATAAYSGGEYIVKGREAICTFIDGIIDRTSGSSHIAVHPEIEFVGLNRASGVWRLEDTVHFTRPNPAVTHVEIRGGEELQGAGYYHDEYIREGSEWRIDFTSYERLYERVARLGGIVSIANNSKSDEGQGVRSDVVFTGQEQSKSTLPRVLGISHFGICVSDLDRALGFYRDGLGFAEGAGIELVDQFGNVMGLEDFTLQTRMLSLNGATIELLYFPRSRAPVVASELRQMNHSGLTHLALSVDDVDAVARLVVAHGGSVFPTTRAVLDSPDGPITLMFCADPDNTRIELINYPPPVAGSEGARKLRG